MEIKFVEFFRSLHGYDPFPWQIALADKVRLDSRWPKVLDLPTGSGKTSCMDIALFAMMTSGEAPRRIYFVVNRRVVVNEAFERMRAVAKKLNKPDDPILEEASHRLRALSGSDDALSVYEMRGGIYRDSSWVNNPLQPTIVLSTVDQVGSRLLFRGYGVSPQVRPIHAALIANDSLIILDEAHCSRPFSQTLGRVGKHLGTESNFQVVEMTATPTPEASGFRITDADRNHPVLSRRLTSPKPTKLVTSKARSDQPDAMAKELVAQARKLQKQSGHKRIVIMANRIATAKAVEAMLKKEGEVVHLLIGRMRPFDRDDMLGELAPFRTGSKLTLEQPQFVVSTQSLEVGADLDFEVLVTEAASIDALLQRFGRLDRAGKLQGLACGAIVLGQVKKEKPDPIYGIALESVTDWLTSLGVEVVDMGLEGASALTIPQMARAIPEVIAERMRQPSKPAAILLPAHIDALAQTSPEPEPSPDVSLFLHGSSDATADVQVIWRADLPENLDVKEWIAILSLCPPGSAEAMPVRISAFRNWTVDQNDADIEGLDSAEPPRNKLVGKSKDYFIWRGEDSVVRTVRPGDTVILRCQEGDWKEFGHIPVTGLAGNRPLDYGDRVSFQQRQRATLRLSPQVVAQWKLNPDQEMLRRLKNEDGDSVRIDLIQDLIEKYLDGSITESWQEKLLTSAARATNAKLISYPSTRSRIEALDFIFTWKPERSSTASSSAFKIDEEAGCDELSFLSMRTLERHTTEVVTLAGRFGEGSQFKEMLCEAAYWHDFGKSDPRFQTMLHGGDKLRAAMAPQLLAKGGEYKAGISTKADLPKEFRHEMLSLAAAQQAIPSEAVERDLVLHLIAAHHGHARPFAPVVIDDLPQFLAFRGHNLTLEAQKPPAHSLASGVAKRYWSLTRRFGWWRLAYLEAMLRLADWNASSAKESE